MGGAENLIYIASNLRQVPQALTRLWKIHPALVCCWDSSSQVSKSDKGGDVGDVFFHTGLGSVKEHRTQTTHVRMYRRKEGSNLQTKIQMKIQPKFK